MKNIIIVLLVCVAIASPVTCISRWFTATFNDLKFTLYRYGFCVNGLQPVTTTRLNETEYLVNQIRNFLDQGNYDNEQLANVSSLMDTICRTNPAEPSYPISVYVDIRSFNGTTNPSAKDVRCRAIGDAMDSMYHVFKRAALNRSEPLDFSSIQFYPNETDRTASYNLSDLINTSWITSEVVLEHVCSITNPTKEYVLAKSSNLTLQSRQQAPTDVASSLYELIDRLLEPILGLQKRLYWESTNRLEFVQSRISMGLQSVRNGMGRTRDIILWRRLNSTLGSSNSTSPLNSTNPMVDALTNLTTTRPFRANSTTRPLNSTEANLSSASTMATTSMPTTRASGTNRPVTSTTVAV